MRTIEVSTDVFARIWALRDPSENSEDEVLKRILFSDTATTWSEGFPEKTVPKGHIEPRYGVCFPEGFTIFRRYKGREYEAKVIGGQWQITGLSQRFQSLNSLSRAIGTKTENAWKNWFFLNQQGVRMPISELRPAGSVVERGNTIGQKPNDLHGSDGPRWCDDVREALRSLGGSAHLSAIYKAVIHRRQAGGRSLPENTEAIIRKELEQRSSDSEAYHARRGEDWFKIRGNKGSGEWSLRNAKSN